MRKIVFLDIDGVLISVKYAMAQRDVPRDEQQIFDPAACRVLYEICTQDQAEIVISSTWRMMYSRPWFEQTLASLGCPITVAGMTPNSVRSGVTRGSQIAEWMAKNKGKTKGHEILSFVILDDDHDMAPNMHRLVQTSPEDGLLPSHIEQAHQILSLDLGGHRIWTSEQLISPKMAVESQPFLITEDRTPA